MSRGSDLLIEVCEQLWQHAGLEGDTEGRDYMTDILPKLKERMMQPRLEAQASDAAKPKVSTWTSPTAGLDFFYREIMDDGTEHVLVVNLSKDLKFESFSMPGGDVPPHIKDKALDWVRRDLEAGKLKLGFFWPDGSSGYTERVG